MCLYPAYLPSRKIGYDISCTCTKLEKLTECEFQYWLLLSSWTSFCLSTCTCLSPSHFLISFFLVAVAKGRSLFGDPTADIQELTQVIKQDLAKLNSDIATLQQQVKARAYHESKHVRTHTSSVVVSLQVRTRRSGEVTK